jgi:hypothetical protein
MRRIGYQNAVLTLIAAFLGIGLVERGVLPEPAPASAQPSDPDQGGLANALEQRKQIITELRLMNSRLDRIEAKLTSGLSVKVTDMPVLKLPPEARAGDKDKTPRPDSHVDVKPDTK